MWGGALTKKGATQVEKRSVEALVGRGAEWSTFFGKYAALKEADVSTLVGMPITLLIAMTPVGTLAGVTIALTNGTIEGVTAHLEGGLEIDEANSMAANIRKQTHDIIAKLQLPTVASVNAIKNTIDKTCAEVATAVHQ